jgi:hypothetical protein
MAILCPADTTPLALANIRSAELETLKALKRDLPNDYLVMHGVHWSKSFKDNTIFGEVDFVIVNRSGDILVIEQKNGDLEESEQGLAKDYGQGPKHVESQVMDLYRRLNQFLRKIASNTNPGMRSTIDSDSRLD